MNVLSPLPANTVTLLRSGQVITCVSSVVKELVENSIDAGANNIEVRLEDYGLDLIEVKDNGSGVAKDNIKFMTAPHYTSKITSFEDLVTDKLRSYGFRGEALNSLSSISDLEIVTKSSGDVVGTLATFDKMGNQTKQSSVAATVGTTIRANKLFSNIPVRRNFFCNNKNRKEEDFKRVKHLVTSYALILPHLRISLYHNKKEVFRKTSAQDFRSSVCQVLGAEIFECLQSIELTLKEDNWNTGQTIVELLVPKNDPLSIKTGSRSSNERFFCFVNERPVTDKPIEKILKKGFPSDRHPVAVVNIKVPPDSVDVNLEPNKQSVLIKRKRELELTIENAISNHYGKEENNLQIENPITIEDGEITSDFEVKQNSFGENVEIDRNLERSNERGNSSTNSIFVERNFVEHDPPINNDALNRCNDFISNDNRDFAVIDDITIMRSRMNATLNFQPKLCDVTQGQDNNVTPSADIRRNAFRRDDLDLSDSDKGLKNDVTHSASKRIRIEDPNQPKLEFFWKEGSELKGSESKLSDSAKFSESHCQRSDQTSDVRNLEFQLQIPDMKHSDSGNFKPNEQIMNSSRPSEPRDSESDLLSPDTETPKSWSRGNYVTDTQGEVIAPVTLGRPFTTMPQPVVSVNGDFEDDDEFDEEDFVLVKRGANQVPLSPPQRSDKKLRTDSSNVSIKNFFTPESREKDESIANSKQSDESPKDRSKARTTIPNKSSENDLSKSKTSSPLKSSKTPKDRFKERIQKPQLNREYRELRFDINRLTTRSNDVETSTVAKTRVLGQLSSSGLWLFVNGETESIELLNHHRVLEVLFFNRLMKTQSLPSAPVLRGPIDLFSEPSWDPELSVTLLELAGGQTQNRIEISDPRFVLNGITIQVRPGTERALLTTVASVVNFMGVDDIAEILKAIKNNKEVSIENCRPLKVKTYLMGEAVRLMRQSPPQLDEDAVLRLIRIKTKSKIQMCLHSMPVSAPLKALSELST